MSGDRASARRPPTRRSPRTLTKAGPPVVVSSSETHFVGSGWRKVGAARASQRGQRAWYPPVLARCRISASIPKGLPREQGPTVPQVGMQEVDIMGARCPRVETLGWMACGHEPSDPAEDHGPPAGTGAVPG